jgi:hypothetical protein
VVREDPDMTELVGDNRLQLVLIQTRQKPLLECHSKRAAVAVNRLHRNQQRVGRHDRGRDDRVDPELRSETVHELLKLNCAPCFAGVDRGSKTDEEGCKAQESEQVAIRRLVHGQSRPHLEH